MKKVHYLLSWFLLGFSGPVSALVPLESLVLGDLSQILMERKSDPIEYVLKIDREFDDAATGAYKKFLAFYRGVYAEGENLKNSCPFIPKISYARPIEEEQVKRSAMATLQYMGLDLASRALSIYAKNLDFSEADWDNLSKRLIGQHCSQNLTIISLKQLKKNLDLYFKHGAGFELPTVQGNILFPAALSSKYVNDKSKELEFLQTVKLFRAMCSWGNESDNPRLLTPFLKNPIIMATVFRNMADKEMAYNTIDGSVYLLERKNRGVKVWCENLICRKKDSDYFSRKVFRAIGSKSLKGDLESLYCHRFRDMDFVTKEQVPQIKKWIDHQSFDDFNFQQSQFISLFTGVPDFLLRAKNFSDGIEILRSSVDQTWENWAKEQIKNRGKELYFEEPLSVELVERELYFNEFRPKFKVAFDVNLGELDRVNRMVGKIRATFNLEIHNSFLAWIRRKWNNQDPRKIKQRNHLIQTFVKTIEDQVKANRGKFILPPWDGNLENLIAEELLSQLSMYKGKFFLSAPTGISRIPIQLNYGPFALKYLSYEAQLKKESQGLDYSTYEYSD